MPPIKPQHIKTPMKNIEIQTRLDQMKKIKVATTNIITFIPVSLVVPLILTFLFGTPFPHSFATLVFWFHLPVVVNAARLAHALSKNWFVWAILSSVPIMGYPAAAFLLYASVKTSKAIEIPPAILEAYMDALQKSPQTAK